MNILSLFVALVYTVVVVGTCAYLLSRGLTHSFILWFGGAALLEAVPRLGFYVLEQMPGGVGENVRWMPAFSAVGMLGALGYVVGFLSLAVFLLKTKPSV